MQCSVCLRESAPAFTAKLMGKHEVSYFSCPHCGFLQTENPWWLKEAYCHAINDEDTGILQRNLQLAGAVSNLISSLFDRKGRFLDFGGGHGLFTRLMRDRGFDFYWTDPVAQNIFARGFEWSGGRAELVSAIECFEHFVNPLAEIGKILAISDSIFFTTWLACEPPPRPEAWEYYGLTHGQHIAFYSLRTLQFLANRFGLQLHTNGSSIHLLTKKQFSPTAFLKALRPGWRSFFGWTEIADKHWKKDCEKIVEGKKQQSRRQEATKQQSNKAKE